MTLPRLVPVLASLFLPYAAAASPCADCSCCRADAACPTTCSASAEPEAAVVEAAFPSPAVRELHRLVTTYVKDAQIRAELLDDLLQSPQRAYAHPVFKLALFSPVDAKSYQALAAEFDC